MESLIVPVLHNLQKLHKPTVPEVKVGLTPLSNMVLLYSRIEHHFGTLLICVHTTLFNFDFYLSNTTLCG